MTKVLVPNLCVLSVWQSDLPTDANDSNHARAIGIIKDAGLVCHSGHGCYKGTTEPCIVIECGSDLALAASVSATLCARHNQESVLAVRNHGEACLFYTDLSAEPVGYWQQVPEWYARSRDSWTEVDDLYYICR